MSRVLLTWELGQNLGHLTRLRQLAIRLQQRGHVVLIAARDLRLASEVLTEPAIPFVQAPGIIKVPIPGWRAAGYPDILLVNGWRNRKILVGLVSAWKTLFDLFRPDCVVLDHSPTAALAAKLSDIPGIWVCTGFGVPPARNPLPSFPGFSAATQEQSTASEAIAVLNANAVAETSGAIPLQGLQDLFNPQHSFLTTFPELDHYGARAEGQYVGPLSGKSTGQLATWPQNSTTRIFAYLRPRMTNLESLLIALKASGAAVVCYAPGLGEEFVGRYASPSMLFPSEPVKFTSLLGNAHACVTYAPSGTVTTGLLHGVPQLMSPIHPESQLTAQRVEMIGAGMVLRGHQPSAVVQAALDRVLHSDRFKVTALQFAARYRDYSAEIQVDRIVDRLETISKEAA